MPRPNLPFYRSQKDAWYARVGGRLLSLGVSGRNGRKAAYAEWHRLQADGGRPVVADRPAAGPPTVRELADQFLADAGPRLKPATLALYRADLDTLTAAHGRLLADRLTAADLSGWLGRQQVSDTTKAIRLRSVSACFGWAVKAGLLEVNPVKRVARPKSRSRADEAVITDADHGKLLTAASPTFRAVLEVLHGTGCRPGEAARITAENFDRGVGVVKLHEHKSDRTGRPRLIYLPPAVARLLTERSERFASGPLLRTARGNPWTGRSITCAMQKLKRKAGVKAMAYGYRHTLATDALANGLPEAHVAELLGHSSTTMLHRHYAHLTSKAGVLRQAAAAVRPA